MRFGYDRYTRSVPMLAQWSLPKRCMADGDRGANELERSAFSISLGFSLPGNLRLWGGPLGSPPQHACRAGPPPSAENPGTLTVGQQSLALA